MHRRARRQNAHFSQNPIDPICIFDLYADRSRKEVLVGHGFRLPSALDNRPLNFEEFSGMQGQTLYVSARDQVRELKRSTGQDDGGKASGASAATKAINYSKKLKAKREAYR